MTTIKSYTDIFQSRKLAEFLPIDSADGFWQYHNEGYSEGHEWAGYEDYPRAEPYLEYTRKENEWKEDKSDVPCWSLAALLEVMPKSIRGTTAFDEEEGWLPFFFYPRLLLTDKQMWQCVYKEYNGGGASKCLTTGESPIDACYEMIIRLNELKLLQL